MVKYRSHYTEYYFVGRIEKVPPPLTNLFPEKDSAKGRQGPTPCFFVDDRITGTTMKRPGFQKMITAIEAGYISAVLVKALCQLGRSYIQVGKLTEEYFSLHDVRQGRTFGIHLILAIQRPDAVIIPRQIKNNMDFRVCGRADSVLSQIILDNTSAAEQIPKDARGRFITGDGIVFQGYLLDEGRL